MPNKPSPPPVTGLDPGRNPYPMVITLGSKKHPQSNRVALTWPSSTSPNRITYQPPRHSSVDGDNKMVPIAEEGKMHTSYVVSPSGQPVLKVQSSYQGYFTPGPYHSSSPPGHPTFGSGRQGTPSSSPYRRRSDFLSERTSSFISFNDSPRPGLKRAVTCSGAPGKEVVPKIPLSPSQDNFRDERQVRNRMSPTTKNQKLSDLSNQSYSHSQNYDSRSGSSFQTSYDCTPNSGRKSLAIRYKKRYESVDNHPVMNGVCQMCCWFLMTFVVLIIFCISLSFIIQEDRNSVTPLIPSQKMKLETYLNQNLFGQPIAVKVISSHLDRFLMSSNTESALVMSFHGGVGVGKSFAWRLLSDYFFSADQKSSCVSTFYVPLYHSWSSEDSLTSLQDWLESRAADCPFRILVVDGLGGDTPCSLVSLLQDTISKFLEDNLTKKHIIVFTSDIAALRINEVSLKYQESSRQEVLGIDHFSHPIKHSFGAIDEFLQQTSEETCHFTGFTSIIDQAIPFLPLERRHIRRCVMRDAKNKGLSLSDGQINWVTDQVSFIPPSWPVFSESGCKLISQKVDLLRAVGEI